MPRLEYQMKKLITDQFFNVGVEEVYERWLSLSNALIDNGDTVHLWANKNFRWGVQVTLNIAEDLGLWKKNEKDMSYVADRIIDFLECEDPLDTCKTLTEAFEIAKEKGRYYGFGDEDTINDMRADLKALTSIARVIVECEKLENTLALELAA